jgi:hypothetical protein
MVVQGANDPRVNKGEADQIVIALRDRKFPVEYLLAPDEGHGFQRPVNNMAMFMAIEKFLAGNLDGRYQQGGTPEVEKRLAEITVDPATVTLAKKVDAAAVGAPKPTSALVPGTYNYQAKIALGAQQMALKLSTTILEQDGAWAVTDTVETPGGTGTDQSVLDKATLTLMKRSLKQGQAAADVDFAGNKASGKMNVNGKETPIAVEMGGPLFADAAGAQQSIAALPLADGYTATFRNFDIQRQKVKLMQLKVTGSESVTVPAGTFDSYKVELSSADGGADKSTVWVAKDSRKPVKMSSVMAQMGGATLTAELLP